MPPGLLISSRTGYVVYANAAPKEDTLKITDHFLRQHGAVSSKVASVMAVQARSLASSSLALSITGIAGPDGGTPDKPVGTVYIACVASPKWHDATPSPSVHVRRLTLHGSRHAIRLQAIRAALALALEDC